MVEFDNSKISEEVLYSQDQNSSVVSVATVEPRKVEKQSLISYSKR